MIFNEFYTLRFSLIGIIMVFCCIADVINSFNLTGAMYVLSLISRTLDKIPLILGQMLNSIHKENSL